MQSFQLANITLLPSLQPVHIQVPHIPYPPQWKAGRGLSRPPQSLGDRIRKHRLELHWLQAHLAKAIGVHVVSVCNWERGTATPFRRMTKTIQEFLDCAAKRVHENSTTGLCAWKCDTNPLANFVFSKRYASGSATATCSLRPSGSLFAPIVEV